MCIDFLRKFPTPTCAPLFLEKFPACEYRCCFPRGFLSIMFLVKKTQPVHRYIRGLPTCSSFSGKSSQRARGFSRGVPNICMFLRVGESPHVLLHVFFGRVKSPCACFLFWGEVRIPNVHRYFGEIQMSIDILGYFSRDQPFLEEKNPANALASAGFLGETRPSILAAIVVQQFYTFGRQRFEKMLNHLTTTTCCLCGARE